MRRTRILGTGRGVPTRVVTNDELAGLVETNDAWITERTGIKERRLIEDGRVTSDLATEAARNACEAAEIAPSSLDCIILATVTPDMPMPATAVYVQQKLGLHGVPSFDLSAACAGFIYGLSIGDAFIKSGQFNRVCVIGVEVLSRILDWSDRNTCVLFGDGAGAVILGPSDDPDRGILSTHIYSDGAGAQNLLIPGGGTLHPTTAQTVADKLHHVKMNGREIFKHAVKNISSASMAALEANGMKAEDVDLVVAHQANLRIIEGVAERCKLPLSKFHLNIHRYGNTSSASVPIALDEAVREGKVKPGMRLLFSALGAGLSWGSAMIRW
jgi:3-oxoacyl-[acyl-carrier-protein] synthase-3